MRIRLRRLEADYRKIRETFQDSTRIKIKDVVGNPPEKYQIEYLLHSMEKKIDGKIAMKNSHLVEIYLSKAYPAQPPQCKMITPIFHPNIAPHAICIGDHWAPGESLTSLILRIGEMIAYQSYNLKSPLNGEAAKWASKNKFRFPIDKFDFTAVVESSEKVVSASVIRGEEAAGELKCANCSKTVLEEEKVLCSSKHITCSDCLVKCKSCGKVLCLKCNYKTCSICKDITCVSCITKCGSCSELVCSNHILEDPITKKSFCTECTVTCHVCKRRVFYEEASFNRENRTYTCSTCDF